MRPKLPTSILCRLESTSIDSVVASMLGSFLRADNTKATATKMQSEFPPRSSLLDCTIVKLIHSGGIHLSHGMGRVRDLVISEVSFL